MASYTRYFVYEETRDATLTGDFHYFLYPRSLATTKAFVVQTGNTSLRKVVPCHYDNDSEGKSGLVKTGLTGLMTTALV